jgi:hypothetical protein
LHSPGCLQRAQDRLVVVKRLKHDHSGKAWSQEVDMFSKLQRHPNIVQIIVRTDIFLSF